MFVGDMSEDEEKLVRKTIRIHPKTNRRMFLAVQKGNFVSESEFIRYALNKCLDELEE